MSDKNYVTRLTGRDPDKLVFRAKNVADVPEKKLTDTEYLCSPKLDGVYAFVLAESLIGDFRMFSRTGEDVVNCPHLIEHFSDFTGFYDRSKLVFIGELWHPEWDQEKISGVARRQTQDDEGKQLQFMLHDCVSLEDFIRGKSDVEYWRRKELLRRFFPGAQLILQGGRGWVWQMDQTASPVHVLHDWPLALASAKGAAQSLIKAAHEGIVVRRRKGLWAAGKRNEDYMRIKEKLSYDLMCIGVEEGVGKCAGMAGALLLAWRLGGKPTGDLVTVRAIGGEFDQRVAWLQDPTMVTGKVVEVEAMKIGKNGMLREPRVKTIKHDKYTPDL